MPELKVDTASFELRGVGQTRAGRTLLQDVDITIPRHLITVLCGPSGGGKTSFLRLLNRLDDPVRGDILFDGRPIAEYMVTTLRRRVAFVFQTPVMFSGTVSDNLAVAAELSGIQDRQFHQLANQVMLLAELEPSLLERPGGELSRGPKAAGEPRTSVDDFPGSPPPGRTHVGPRSRDVTCPHEDDWGVCLEFND